MGRYDKGGGEGGVRMDGKKGKDMKCYKEKQIDKEKVKRREGRK